MKLKYYLRGLGIGILLTTLILSIGGKEKLSEQEIRKEALKLGMVDQEDSKNKDNLGELLDEVTSTPEENEADEAISTTPDPTTAPSPTTTPSPTPTPTPVTELTATPVPIEQDSEEITFTIENGMSSNKVSILLEDKGLIDNALKFNQYVTQEGKADYIRVGTYTLPKSASYEVILDKITK